MELINEFQVSVPIDRAWEVLTDVERVAPCLPGAQLQEVEGDQYRGIVKVKVGPITAQYKGTASFVELDPAARRAVLKAEGRDTRGQGNANAMVTATLFSDGLLTSVKVVTDLTITGKVAQFGRGVLADVSTKLMEQFVDNLERDVLNGVDAAYAAVAIDAGTAGEAVTATTPAATPSEPTPAAPASEPTPAATPSEPTPAAPADPTQARPSAAEAPGGNGAAPSAIRRIDAPEPEPVDLLGTAGLPVAKRAVPAIAAAVVLLWVLRRRRRRRRARRTTGP